MRNTTARVLLACTMVALGMSALGLTTQQDPKPMYGKPVELFNGKNLEGWTAFFQGGETNPAEAFFVEDGILKCKGRPIGYLQTKQRYTSFKLVVEWRFDPEKGAGNSGVLLRVNGKDKVWPNSIEAQLHSRNAGDIWNIGNFPMKTAEDRQKGRRTVKAHDTNEKPLGEWNRYDILLSGETLELKVNGLVQNEAGGCSIIPGRIGLQSEGSWIEFRKVELTPILPTGKKG